ncbi:MAG: hypothetical protein RI591_07710, partial [Dehalococcoidia bacterium]|nr:hypothetical protein [Dehalococcoidia bacterium]
ATYWWVPPTFLILAYPYLCQNVRTRLEASIRKGKPMIPYFPTFSWVKINFSTLFTSPPTTGIILTNFLSECPF